MVRKAISGEAVKACTRDREANSMRGPSNFAMHADMFWFLCIFQLESVGTILRDGSVDSTAPSIFSLVSFLFVFPSLQNVSGGHGTRDKGPGDVITMASKMSAGLRLSGLDDFIAPSQACIKPVATPAQTPAQIGLHSSLPSIFEF
jgi:hypothetical protein